MIERLRPDQREVLDAVLRAFRRGARVVVLDAPTGVGKTWIARAAIEAHGRGVYACRTVRLQEQVLRDFPEAVPIAGRARYSSPDGKTCAECAASEDRCRRRSCPYAAARRASSAADLAVTTTAYLVESGRASRWLAGRDLGVIDECDLLPDELSRLWRGPLAEACSPEEALWSQCRRWLAMSASLIGGAEAWARDARLDPDSVALVEAPDLWDTWRRQVHAVPVTALGWHPDEEIDQARLDVAARDLRGVIASHERQRVLIHAGSYLRAREIGARLEALEDRPVLYPRGEDAAAGTSRQDDLERALASYRALEHAVLVAPALERGLDLPDEACRAIILPHLPWPPRERLSDVGEDQYVREMLRSLVQACGRACRHSRDWCATYITDRSWPGMLAVWGALLPRWFRALLT